MAISAINAKFSHVMLMAEGNRLRPRVVHFGDIRRLVDDVHGVSEQCDKDHRTINADACNGIRAVMKNLSHTNITRSLSEVYSLDGLSASLWTADASSICGKRHPRSEKGPGPGNYAFTFPNNRAGS